MTAPHEILRVGKTLRLNMTTRWARYGNRWARLTPTEAAVLASFMREPDRVIFARELLQEHWQGIGDIRIVRARVSELRRKLGADLIRTVQGTGYQLTAPGTSPRVLLQAGDLVLLAGGRLTHRDRDPVDLTAREERQVGCVMRRAGRRATDEEMRRAARISSNDVNRYHESMSRLRHKLAAIGADDLLLSLPGGYRLAGTPGLQRIAGLELDLRTRAARLHGRPLEMSPSWFGFLERLAVVPGRSVPEDELVADLWEPGSHVDLRWIVRELQDALGAIGPELIASTADGYRFAIERFGLLAVGRLLFDRDARCVRIDDREEHLSPTESMVTEALMQALGRPLPRPQLQAQAGQKTPRTLENAVLSLRLKLRRLAGLSRDGDLIVYLAGLGYRLAVERLDADELDWPLQFAGLWFRPETRQVRYGNRTGTLAQRPAALLEQLIAAAGEVVTDTELKRAIWNRTPEPVALVRCVTALERGLSEVCSAVTVERIQPVGYRLAPRDPA